MIKRETGLSKAAFKRAIGHLYKERKKLHWMVEKSARVSYNAGKGKKGGI